MRVLPEGLLENQLGSLSTGHMEFSSWYDGRCVASRLPISDWTQTFTAGEQVKGVTNINVTDLTGELSPWGVDEPLGVGGAIIKARLVLDRASVNLGYQRITESSPSESWQFTPAGLRWVPGGAVVDVKAEDMTVMVSGAKFTTPETPLSGNTCIPEIKRLLYGLMDVTILDEVIDRPVPASITYKDERLDAVEDLIAAIDCAYRVSGNGQLVIYKPNRVSVWTVKGGDWSGDWGNLISIGRSQSIGDLKNLVIARTTLKGGDELQAFSAEESGPLRVNGPHGVWPVHITDDFATNQYEIQEAAYHGRNSYLKSRVVSMPLTTIFHPGLELGDWITVMCPVSTGNELPLEGRVTSIQYGGTGLPSKMNITMDVDQSAIQNVSDILKAQRWSR